MKPKAWRWSIVTLVVIAVIAIGLIQYRGDRGVTPVSERDEIIAAEALLGSKLSGPRYFNSPVAGIREEGGPWINVADALSQVSRVAGARKLGPEAVHEIGRLIEQMAEPHPSRMVGGERINLLRLNLSLDAVH